MIFGVSRLEERGCFHRRGQSGVWVLGSGAHFFCCPQKMHRFFRREGPLDLLFFGIFGWPNCGIDTWKFQVLFSHIHIITLKCVGSIEFWNIHPYIPSWWFQIFFMFTPIWGRFPIWWAYFSTGLVQPPTRYIPGSPVSLSENSIFVAKRSLPKKASRSLPLPETNSKFAPENRGFSPGDSWSFHHF